MWVIIDNRGCRSGDSCFDTAEEAANFLSTTAVAGKLPIFLPIQAVECKCMALDFFKNHTSICNMMKQIQSNVGGVQNNFVWYAI